MLFCPVFCPITTANLEHPTFVFSAFVNRHQSSTYGKQGGFCRMRRGTCKVYFRHTQASPAHTAGLHAVVFHMLISLQGQGVGFGTRSGEGLWSHRCPAMAMARDVDVDRRRSKAMSASSCLNMLEISLPSSSCHPHWACPKLCLFRN